MGEALCDIDLLTTPIIELNLIRKISTFIKDEF